MLEAYNASRVPHVSFNVLGTNRDRMELGRSAKPPAIFVNNDSPQHQSRFSMDRAMLFRSGCAPSTIRNWKGPPPIGLIG